MTNRIDRGLTLYGDTGFSRFLRRAFLASAGLDDDDLRRPIVGIADTRSDYTPCHRQLPELIAAVRRGVTEAGGLPFAFPTMSLGEILISPTTMLYRNLMAMETEELIRAQPMDAVVLVGGCDKTVPAQLMAAVSANIPALLVVAGPMYTGSWRGTRLGACTDCRAYWAQHRAGTINAEDVAELRDELCPTAGTCMVMGSASTMACLAEALGMMLPGSATAPAASGERLRHGVAAGRRAVALAHEGLRPRSIITSAAIHNALVCLLALGGSTNAIIHLTAIARRAGIELDLRTFGDHAARVPTLVDCKPAGAGYMEDFHRAGGMPALLKELEPLLETSTRGSTGRTLAELLRQTVVHEHSRACIRSLKDPLKPAGGLAVLHGSLAPNGAVLKASAATAALLNHKGPALVFDSPEDAAERLDDPQLEVTADHVLVLRNAALVGDGMPEAGSRPIPRRLAAEGVTDMVRVSDARMSGTAFGTVVLHCSPEGALGGPIGLVRNGDLIELDAVAGRLDLLVDDHELKARAAVFTPPTAHARGWRRLFAEHVLPPEQGADLDFLS
jgi:dihydroxy-acid dehydratase